MKPSYSKGLLKGICIIFISMFFVSCAAILSGANQNIKVKTQPKGATVYINGQNTFKQTPCKVKVKRRQKKPLQFRKENNLEIEVKKEGYQDAKLIVKSSFNVVSVGSIVLFVVPFIPDLIVGAHLRYPRRNYLAMEPEESKIIPPLRPVDEFADGEDQSEPEYQSDIDKNIPEIRGSFSNKFALIIGNEHYSSHFSNLSSEIDVSYAINDASLFKEYAQKTLGIPNQNIIYLTDATLAQMQKGINKLKLLSQNYGSESELYFYYAGHGLPHEATREPYLLPIDLSGSDIDMAIKLDHVFASLSEYPTKKTTCILDCCFSGGARNSELIKARGVKIVPKQNPVSGNMVVFTASSGDQTALAYDQKKHGLFTYLLLKKLQESNGKVTFGEMQNYLKKEVAIKSILINDKEQYPQIIVSPQIVENWKDWNF